MNKEQQDKIWNDLSEEKRNEYRNLYQKGIGYVRYEDGYLKGLGQGELNVIVDVFGKHNLNPKPPIKTWEDVEKECPNIKSETDTLNYHISTCIVFNDKIDKKLIATYKIAKLIELGYGGMVSEEEWKDNKIRKYVVKWCAPDEHPYNEQETRRKYFIAFHTPEQREEFMSYESNRKLVEQYYLM